MPLFNYPRPSPRGPRLGERSDAYIGCVQGWAVAEGGGTIGSLPGKNHLTDSTLRTHHDDSESTEVKPPRWETMRHRAIFGLI